MNMSSILKLRQSSGLRPFYCLPRLNEILIPKNQKEPLSIENSADFVYHACQDMGTKIQCFVIYAMVCLKRSSVSKLSRI